MAVLGAGILILTPNGQYVLTGKESRYLTDHVNQVNMPQQGVRSVESLQLIDAATIEEAKARFTNRAKGISQGLNMRIQYSQPVQAGPGQWTTTYRFLPPDFKYGIPKGKREGAEAPAQTARREFAEEVGGQLQTLPVQDIGIMNSYQIYKVVLPDDGVVNAILQKIAERFQRNYSELFDVKFRPISTMKTVPNINAISRAAVNMVGGKKKKRTRRTRRRGTRRRYLHDRRA